MSLRLIYRATQGEFAEAMKEIHKPIAKAAKGSIVDMADAIKAQGRADIAAAGFSTKWQNTFRVDTYPKGVSIDAAALVYHKIPYADVFEAGATIRGKPMLWLPLSSTPKRIDRKKMTPELFVQKIGPLFPINRPGKPPLLAANAPRLKRGGVGKVTNAKLRKGASGTGATQAVPLFIGISTVELGKKFHLRQITDRAAGRLAQLYFKNLRDD